MHFNESFFRKLGAGSMSICFDDEETIHIYFQILFYLMDYFRSKLFGQNQKQPAAAAAASSTTTDDENQSDNGLTIEYFQTQFLLDCLMRTVYNTTDQKELIAMCYEQIPDNQNELRMLSDFERKYSSDRALWWYIQESFLYKILNYSLESQDIRNLFLFRKILRDINNQMQQHRCSTPLHVYRSQLMPMELLSKWISSVGQCVVINSFLSATISHEVAVTYLNSNQVSKEDCERVLLEIDADPRIIGSKPFVQVGTLNYSGDENEVIFMFGSIFLINNITCGNDGLYTIEMTLYSDNDHEFKQIFDDMKKKYGDGELDLLTFAQILKDLDRFNEAEEYTNRYLETLPADHEDAILCYNLLGSIASARADFETSLMWYNRALEFRMRKSSRSIDPKLAETHENIGDIYWKQGNEKSRLLFIHLFNYI
jgi:tetratricopeptide (TPR) repeat protein